MRNNVKKAFTLVELLVVITILAIISVIAYQNFGGAVDKAVSGRKLYDVATIETALQQFKADNTFYPPTDLQSSTNLFGYTGGVIANISNTIKVVYNGVEITSIDSASTKGGGKVYGTGTWASAGASARQIGAKGTISRETFGKKYLSKDLYDPELGDLKVGTDGKKMIDSGIGRYIYYTYKKNTSSGAWASNYNGVAYNMAYTFKKDGSDTYLTKIIGDYDQESCYEDKATCPSNLTGLNDGSTQNGTTDMGNYGIPYGVTDFAK